MKRSKNRLKQVLLLWMLGGILLGLTACNTTHSTLSSPNQKAANYNMQLGLGYMQQGNQQRAKSKLLLAIQQAPNWAPVYGAMAYYLEMTGDQAEAEQHYLRALALAPKMGASHNNYGTFLCRNGRYQEAIQQFNLAISDAQYINGAGAYENAGLCAMKMPNSQVAQQYFKRALQQDPKRSTSILELAQLSYNQGQYTLAKNYLDRYFKLSGPDPQSLWLGIRVAHKVDDPASANYYAKLLKQRFPSESQVLKLPANSY